MLSGLLDSKRNSSLLYRKLFSMYWGLPYGMRKFVFHLVLPGQYKSWQALRANSKADEDDYSLAPFDKNECIFIHIPKCAGVSVAKSLFGNRAGGHKTMIQYQLIFSFDEIRRYFKFTIVRNPWDRLVSAFTFLKQGGLRSEDRQWAERNIDRYHDFRSFVMEWLDSQTIYSYYHFIPQYEFLIDPKTNQMYVDFIGRFETLEQDFEKVCRKLKIPALLLKQNKTGGRQEEYREYYNHQTQKIVAQVYQKDIELFGYSF